ncbi:Fc.00g046160.m01.CDS01 [Cosmosporella sp. VM-42]
MKVNLSWANHLWLIPMVNPMSEVDDEENRQPDIGGKEDAETIKEERQLKKTKQTHEAYGWNLDW